MSIIEKGQTNFTDTSLPVLISDWIINSGSLFCFDFANPSCLANNATLTNGLAIPNLVSGAPSGSLLYTSGDLAVAAGTTTVKGIQKLNGNNNSGPQFDTGTQYFQANLTDDFLVTTWAIQPGYYTTLALLYAADVATPFSINTAAIVVADGTGSNDGTWRKTGTGTGSGNWTQLDNVASLSTGNWLLRKMNGTTNGVSGIYMGMTNGYTSAVDIAGKFSDSTGNNDYNDSNAAALGSRPGLHQVAVAKLGSSTYAYLDGSLLGSASVSSPLTAQNCGMYFGIQPSSSYTAISGLILCRAWAEDLTISAAAAGVSTSVQAANQIATDHTFVTTNNRFT